MFDMLYRLILALQDNGQKIQPRRYGYQAVNSGRIQHLPPGWVQSKKNQIPCTPVHCLPVEGWLVEIQSTSRTHAPKHCPEVGCLGTTLTLGPLLEAQNRRGQNVEEGLQSNHETIGGESMSKHSTISEELAVRLGTTGRPLWLHHCVKHDTQDTSESGDSQAHQGFGSGNSQSTGTTTITLVPQSTGCLTASEEVLLLRAWWFHSQGPHGGVPTRVYPVIRNHNSSLTLDNPSATEGLQHQADIIIC